MARDGLTEGTPYVSVQRVGGPGGEGEHLAWGVLISKDVVIVDLAEWPADARLEVLVASAHGKARPVVERIAMSKVEIVGTEDRLDSTLAAVKLAHDSRQAPEKSGFDLDALQRGLVDDPDLWGGLERLGYLPREIHDIDTDEVLRRIAEWERILRRDLVIDLRPQSLDEVGLRICCFWRCDKCHTRF